MALIRRQSLFVGHAILRGPTRVRHDKMRRMLSSSPRVYMDIAMEQRLCGRLVFELRKGVCPHTAENFIGLLQHTRGFGYRGSPFHRIIPGFMAQGGDFDRRDGTGGSSIWGGSFPDENFILKHEKRGMLAMANHGPNTAGSQFYVTFAPVSHLDGKHVVFGELVDGFGVLDVLESVGTKEGEPEVSVTISDCGVE